MPSVSDAIKAASSLADSGYTPSGPGLHPSPPPVSTNLEPGRSHFLRCPLPALWSSTPDSQRQAYSGSIIPQFRVMTPQSAIVSGSAGTVSGTGTSGSSGSGGGSGGGGGGTAQPTAQSVSTTSGSLNPNQTFVSSVQVAKSFALLGATVSGPARVQLYGTRAAQTSDAYRGLDVPPPAGTLQGLICDVALDTAPYTWTFQDRVGANCDTPQTPTTYLTLTNIGSAPGSVTVTLLFVPLES